MAIPNLTQAVQIASLFSDETLTTQDKIKALSKEERDFVKAALKMTKNATVDQYDAQTKSFKAAKVERSGAEDELSGEEVEDRGIRTGVIEDRLDTGIIAEPKEDETTIDKVLEVVKHFFGSIAKGFANIFWRTSSRELFLLGQDYRADKEKAKARLEKFHRGDDNATEGELKKAQYHVVGEKICVESTKRATEINKALNLTEITNYLLQIEKAALIEKGKEKLAKMANFDEASMKKVNLEPVVLKSLFEIVQEVPPLALSSVLHQQVLLPFYKKIDEIKETIETQKMEIINTHLNGVEELNKKNAVAIILFLAYESPAQIKADQTKLQTRHEITINRILNDQAAEIEELEEGKEDEVEAIKTGYAKYLNEANEKFRMETDQIINRNKEKAIADLIKIVPSMKDNAEDKIVTIKKEIRDKEYSHNTEIQKEFRIACKKLKEIEAPITGRLGRIKEEIVQQETLQNNMHLEEGLLDAKFQLSKKF